MKIGAISNVSAANRVSNPNFNGRWERKSVQKYVDYTDPDTYKQVYVPDEGEDAYTIAQAWKSHTGYYPIDWVKSNNIYNQSQNPIQYEIKDASYMPLEVLRASVNLKYNNLNSYDHNEKIEKYIELAKLSSQKGDDADVKCQENKMIDEMKQIHVPKLMVAAAWQMNNYKDGFGTETMYGIRYGKN